MNLLIKSRPLAPGYNDIAGPGDAPLKYLSLGRLRLTKDVPRYETGGSGDEVVISILSGRCNVRVEGVPTWADLGGRESMLDGPPTMACIPRGRAWHVEKLGEELDAVVSRAPARSDKLPALVRPDDGRVVTIGAGEWERRAAMAVTDNVEADRLLVGETYNLPGRWSSFPPHKHDVDTPPREAWYEEIYHFAVRPRSGFGIQRVYTSPDDPSPLDEVYVVRDGDTVVIPRGYHPVVAAGDCRVGYLWALAGEGRAFGAWTVDPAFSNVGKPQRLERR